MATRFTPDEDRYICTYFDAAGAHNIARDLSRSAESIKTRAKKLRKAGCFDLHHNAHVYSVMFNVAAGHMTAEDADLIHGIQIGGDA